MDKIKERIECLDKTQQIEILKILVDEKHAFTENKNGTFFNAIELTKSTLSKLDTYIGYIEEQNISFEIVEENKKTLHNTFFST
jgi:hypothetical protein